jgi:hypothetical protein
MHLGMLQSLGLNYCGCAEARITIITDVFNTLWALTGLFEKQVKLGETEEALVEAIEICKETVGAEAALTKACMDKLANILWTQGRYEEA